MPFTFTAAALQDIRGGDPMKQQYMQFQQPLQYLQQSCNPNQLLQEHHIMQQSLPQQILHAKYQKTLSDNQSSSMLQQPPYGQHSQNQQSQQHQQNFQIPNNQFEQQETPNSQLT